jgi:hypothetical protein
LDEEQGAEDVDSVGLVELLKGDVAEEGVLGDAGVVDDDVDLELGVAGEGGLCLADQTGCAFWGADVGLYGEGSDGVC